ncbi:MAG TPA: cell division protein FtsH, partial [Pseudogulbenkiania sp.]|nr:cell division protein FtsH [Pseudogulbenkiania sp.]
FDESHPAAYLDVQVSQPHLPYSERTAQAIDDEMRKLLTEAHARVEHTLQTNRASLEALAKLLLEKEVVDRATLDDLLSSQAAPRKTGSSATNAPEEERGQPLPK